MSKLLAFSAGDGTVSAPGLIKTGGLKDLERIISGLVWFVLVVAVILSLLFLIYGGFKWMTSQGESSAIESAKKTMIYAAVGLFIALISFVLISLIGNFFGFNPFQPAP